MRKSNIEKIRELKRRKVDTQHMSLEDLMLLLLDPREKERRQANPTQRKFITEYARNKGFMGAKGSAKTSSGAAAIFLRALLMPGTKALVVRNDYNDLKQTTRLRFEEMLNRLPPGILLDRTKEPPETWYIQAVPVYDAKGEILDDTPSSITFAGLASLGEAGSYEYDAIFVDEASEVEERSVQALQGLFRNIPIWWEREGMEAYTLMMAFNPTPNTHWLYTACTGLDHTGRKVREPWVKLYTPEYKENQRNLPSRYYEEMAETMPADMRVRLIEGRWGAVFEGDPVVREFKYDIHARDDLIKHYDVYTPLFRFWDFGYRRPYVVWAQFDYKGRLLHLREKLGENMEIGPFIDLVRAFEKQHFPGHEDFIDIGDPAARQKKDTGSTLQVLSERGILLKYKIATIDDGLAAVRIAMDKYVDGEPLLQFDRRYCPVLIQAWSGGYHTDDKGKPVKDGHYDHPADADRYGTYFLFGVTDNRRAMKDMPKSLEYNPNLDTFARGR